MVTLWPPEATALSFSWSCSLRASWTARTNLCRSSNTCGVILSYLRLLYSLVHRIFTQDAVTQPSHCSNPRCRPDCDLLEARESGETLPVSIHCRCGSKEPSGFPIDAPTPCAEGCDDALEKGWPGQNSSPSVTTLAHMTIYGYQPKNSIEHRVPLGVAGMWEFLCRETVAQSQMATATTKNRR